MKDVLDMMESVKAADAAWRAAEQAREGWASQAVRAAYDLWIAPTAENYRALVSVQAGYAHSAEVCGRAREVFYTVAGIEAAREAAAKLPR